MKLTLGGQIMTFQEEMDKFFKSFSAEDRAKVEQTFAHREAAAKEDAVQAAEIAHSLIVGVVDEYGMAYRPLDYL